MFSLEIIEGKENKKTHTESAESQMSKIKIHIKKNLANTCHKKDDCRRQNSSYRKDTSQSRFHTSAAEKRAPQSVKNYNY